MNKTKTAVSIIIFSAALCAGFLLLRQYYPQLLRHKTEMEKKHTVCVLGVSENTGIISGDRAGIRNIFINWKTSFPVDTVLAIKKSGAVPMITWEPYLEKQNEKLLPDIAAGKYHEYINKFAAACGNEPLFLRFAHEPNGDWYGWSGAPGVYIAAFRHVRSIFRNGNGKNVKFIFSVNANDVPAAAWNRFENYYPGGDCADIIGLDAYNWGKLRRWQSPEAILQKAYERSVKAFPSKPVFISETASCGLGGDKKAWIQRLKHLLQKRFLAVKAVIWFNIDKECDWSISSGDLRDQFYAGCGTGHFDCSAQGVSWLFGGN
jgi:hypothetical protein